MSLSNLPYMRQACLTIGEFVTLIDYLNTDIT